MIYDTKILFVKNSDSHSLEEAVKFLRGGEIIAFPTETVYGLGADVFDVEACKKVFIAKGRTAGNPLSAHCSSIEQAGMVADISDKRFQLIYDKFLPGPVAVVLPKLPIVPDIVTAGMNTISIRIPSNDVASALFNKFGRPVAGTSANLAGKPSPTSAMEVMEDLSGRIPAILDDGSSMFGIESTIISLIGKPLILRPGVIPKEEIEEAIGEKIEFADASIPMPAIQRYKPKTPLIIFESNDSANEYLEEHNAEHIMILASDMLSIRQSKNIKIEPLRPETLYSTLRTADRENFDLIALIMDENSKLNEALAHRIKSIFKLK